MGRVEILTGLERRRVWSDGEKLAILSELASGTETVVEVARRHDVLPQQIYAWRRRFRRIDEPTMPAAAPMFLPVTVVPSSDPAEAENRATIGKDKSFPRRSSTVEIRCKGGRVLKVDADLSTSLLQGLVRAVEGA